MIKPFNFQALAAACSFFASACTVVLAASLAGACSSDDSDDNGTGSSENANANDISTEPALARLEFPKVKGGNSIVLIHVANDGFGINYSTEWDTDKMSQRWSCYQLNSPRLAKNTSRYYPSNQDDQYPLDPLLPNTYLNKDYYWNSGFDHGHICPSADRLYSAEANMQTFYLTNLQPQYKAFNGSLSGSKSSENENSPWYRLETQIRTWANATTTEMLYVVKGGTIEDHQILPNKAGGKLRVPKYFFNALLLKNKEGYKAVGFWMEHLDSYPQKLPLANYACNIRELEQKTGIDFFCNLPDDVENKVETLPMENLKRAWGL
jgi:endonuclease G